MIHSFYKLSKMKAFYYCLLLGIIPLYLNTPYLKKENQVKRTTICLKLDDYICNEGQWIYLYGYKDWISGDEKAIFDSTFISRGQHTATLQAYIPGAQSLNLLFEKRGPVSMQFAIEPDSCIEIDICEEDGDVSLYKKVKSGSLNNRIHAFLEERTAYLNSLRTLLEKNSNKEAEKLQIDSFDKFKNMLLAASNAEEAYEIAICFTIDFRSRNTEVKKIIEEIATKFPSSIPLQEYSKKKKGTPATAESLKANARIHQLQKQRENITPYPLSLGDKLILSFSDEKGNKIQTTDQQTDYMLVDFWASWCKPCRKEISNIKQAASRYKKQLSIYAVSLDSNKSAWQKAIRQDSTQAFKHVIGTYPNGQPTQLLKRLRIKEIPMNFLIDKDQHIVAKDLYGEQIIQTLDSLLNNNIQ